MNNLNFIKNALFAAIALFTIAGCVQDDDYSVPPLNCNNRWEANTNIEAVKALNDTDVPLLITENLVLEGYVVSSDETGNFFKTMSIQNSLTDPTAGMQIEMDMTNLYTFYPVGSRVVVDLKGLYVAKDRGTYKVGYVFDSNGVERVGRMSEDLALAHVAKTCEDSGEVVPVSYATIPEAMNEAHLNTLIKLENVQFQTAGNGETYYDEDNAFGGATNVTVIDSQGNTMVLRNSSYADFAADILPDGSGTLTAVLSAYSTSNNVTPSTYQLFIRDTSDVQFDQPRMEIVNGEGPIGGGDAAYNACLSEDFESFNADLVNFADYINFAYNGDRYWGVKTFNNNKYLQMSSYNADGANEVYFIIPVNFDEADEFSFKSKMRYYNGDALTVYYSNTYEINDTPSGLTDITSAFTLSDGSSDDFISSGTYDLSGISGNGAIFFKYTGVDGGITTTVQLDDIMIGNNDDPDCGNGGGTGETAPIPFTETFNDGVDNWTLFNVTGDRLWLGREFDGEFYAQNSAYSSSAILDIESWMISPEFDFDAQAGESMVLNIADAYNNGNPLKVFYSTDYSGSGNPSDATWVQIGADQIAALNANTGGYDNVYEATSAIDLSGIAGTGYIAFVYDSADATISTTIQISNVQIN